MYKIRKSYKKNKKDKKNTTYKKSKKYNNIKNNNNKNNKNKHKKTKKHYKKINNKNNSKNNSKRVGGSIKRKRELYSIRKNKEFKREQEKKRSLINDFFLLVAHGEEYPNREYIEIKSDFKGYLYYTEEKTVLYSIKDFYDKFQKVKTELTLEEDFLINYIFNCIDKKNTFTNKYNNSLLLQNLTFGKNNINEETEGHKNIIGLYHFRIYLQEQPEEDKYNIYDIKTTKEYDNYLNVKIMEYYNVMKNTFKDIDYIFNLHQTSSKIKNLSLDNSIMSDKQPDYNVHTEIIKNILSSIYYDIIDNKIITYEDLNTNREAAKIYILNYISNNVIEFDDYITDLNEKLKICFDILHNILILHQQSKNKCYSNIYGKNVSVKFAYSVQKILDYYSNEIPVFDETKPEDLLNYEKLEKIINNYITNKNLEYDENTMNIIDNDNESEPIDIEFKNEVLRTSIDKNNTYIGIYTCRS